MFWLFLGICNVMVWGSLIWSLLKFSKSTNTEMTIREVSKVVQILIYTTIAVIVGSLVVTSVPSGILAPSILLES